MPGKGEMDEDDAERTPRPGGSASLASSDGAHVAERNSPEAADGPTTHRPCSP